MISKVTPISDFLSCCLSLVCPLANLTATSDTEFMKTELPILSLCVITNCNVVACSFSASCHDDIISDLQHCNLHNVLSFSLQNLPFAAFIVKPLL